MINCDVKTTQQHDNNFQLAQNGDQYEVGASQIFENLAELIEHHRNNAMVERTGTVVNLKQPYNATRLYAAAINNRVEELNLNALKRGRNNSGFWEEFEVCGCGLSEFKRSFMLLAFSFVKR